MSYNYDEYKREIIDERDKKKRTTVNLSSRSMRRRVSRKETQPKKIRIRRILTMTTKNKNQNILLEKEINVLKGRQIEMEADLKSIKEHVDRWVKDEN